MQDDANDSLGEGTLCYQHYHTQGKEVFQEREDEVRYTEEAEVRQRIVFGELLAPPRRLVNENQLNRSDGHRADQSAADVLPHGGVRANK